MTATRAATTAAPPAAAEPPPLANAAEVATAVAASATTTGTVDAASLNTPDLTDQTIPAASWKKRMRLYKQGEHLCPVLARKPQAHNHSQEGSLSHHQNNERLWPPKEISVGRLSKATCTRTRIFRKRSFRPPIHRNGHTYPHVSGAFWKRSGPKTELFENAPESGSFKNGRFGSGSVFACEHGIRIFSATVSKAIKNGVPQRWILLHVHLQVAAHFFLFRRELPSKTKRRMVAVVFRSNSTSSSS